MTPFNGSNFLRTNQYISPQTSQVNVLNLVVFRNHHHLFLQDSLSVWNPKILSISIVTKQQPYKVHYFKIKLGIVPYSNISIHFQVKLITIIRFEITFHFLVVILYKILSHPNFSTGFYMNERISTPEIKIKA